MAAAFIAHVEGPVLPSGNDAASKRLKEVADGLPCLFAGSFGLWKYHPIAVQQALTAATQMKKITRHQGYPSWMAALASIQSNVPPAGQSALIYRKTGLAPAVLRSLPNEPCQRRYCDNAH